MTPVAIGRIVGGGRCDAVINAAAYTDVDLAESDEAAAIAINAEAPSRISVETARLGIPLIHISTDYVFDGRKGAPYLEHDKIGPLNAYGRSKAAGEQGVRSGNPRHVILRTSWVFSHRRTNFVKTVLRLATQQDQLENSFRSAWMPDAGTRCRASIIRNSKALHGGSAKYPLWDLSFRGRWRSKLV